MELVPKKDPQKISGETWYENTPEKLELYDGEAFWGDPIREKLLLTLLYNIGLEAFLKLLPEESKDILRKLLM